MPTTTQDAGQSSREQNYADGLKENDWANDTVGKRVGYEDLTAIDWVWEYAKDRAKIRRFRSEGGLLGTLKEAAFASQIWVILVFTGLAAGLFAACIDTVTDWLADLKVGFCAQTFYLSRKFCCWGLDDLTKCQEWVQWHEVLHITSGFGRYVIDYTVFVLFGVVFATSASVLVAKYAPFAKHSGIAEMKTILGGFIIHRFLSAWVLCVKSLGLALAVGSGMWLGKEGPLVHVACCCANFFMKFFYNFRSNEARKREVLSAAAAAGISVAFGAPIGGVLFSLEQVSYYFPDKTMWQSFVCAMVAAVTLQFMNPFRTDKLVLFDVVYSTGWHGFELLPFCILGVFGGIYGALFIKLNRQTAIFRKNSFLRHYPLSEVTVLALLSALINYPNPFTRAQLSQLLAHLFAECRGNDELNLCDTGATASQVTLLLLAAVIGLGLTSLTFGTQLPAGIILPTMAIGALVGRAVGILAQATERNFTGMWVFRACEPDVECITPGVYAIVGAAAALGGVTRLTVSIVVIMFELTGALTYVLPIMIVLMISKWVGDAFSKEGIYESWIRLNEYPLLSGGEKVPDLIVCQVMTRVEDLVMITATGHSIETLEILLRDNLFKGFPVVTETVDAILLGYISRSELRFALQQGRQIQGLSGQSACYFAHKHLVDSEDYVDLRPWMDQTPTILSYQSPLFLAVDLFQKLGLRYIVFTHHGHLQGLLTKKDVWRLLSFRAFDESQEEQGHRLLDVREGV